MPKAALLLTTVDSRHKAKQLAEQLLALRLAACVTVFPQAESHYWWRGKRERSGEAVLLIKTSVGRMAKLARAFKKLHPYDLPELIALPVAWGSPAYLAWLHESLEKPQGSGWRKQL